jgi:hypothetical protein
MRRELQEAILLELSAHRGVDRRISRRDLLKEVREKVSTSDREMRAAIEELRRGHAHGVWICADLRGGYFMARDADEIEAFLSSDERRAQRLLERVRLQRRSIDLQSGGQQELFIDDGD